MFVENSVDNSEDNCVENKQMQDAQTPDWVRLWSQYLIEQLQLRTNTDQSHEDALNLIERVLLASHSGESCIQVSAQAVESLGKLVIYQSDAAEQVAPLVYDDQALFLYRYWQLEQRLAQQVRRIQAQQVIAVETQAFKDLLPDPQQQSALSMVAQQALSIITGGPGTGKTYTLARIIAVLNHSIKALRIAMAAPTGKAAQRMKEALQQAFSDEKLEQMGLMDAHLRQQDTMTLHRLLGLGHHGQPRFNRNHPLPYDVIVVDEASMLDLQLATQLFEAIPEHCRLILLGDAQQLASVDVGDVLADLQAAEILHANRVQLITSRRFKADALIGKMAKFIQSITPDTALDGVALRDRFAEQIVAPTALQAIALDPDMADVIELEYLPESVTPSDFSVGYEKLSWGYRAYFEQLQQYMQNTNHVDAEQSELILKELVQAFDLYRILTPIRFGALGLSALNREMEQALLQHLPMIIKQGDWYLGRPVMITQNDHQLGLSNGDIGLCLPHRSQAQQFEVYFAHLDLWVATTRLPKSIQTAFAMTIHKSQGSEFRHVAVVFDAHARRLISQELLYTAITRAKSALSLWVDADTFAQGLTIKTTRHSGLTRKIQMGVDPVEMHIN